jgi:hypothetical protein
MKHRLLKNVRSSNYFYLIDGTSIKNIYELLEKVKTMDNDSFNHYTERKEFHSWVSEVHQDHKLAKNLLNALNQKKAASVIQRRIDEVGRTRIPNKKSIIPTNSLPSQHNRYQIMAGLIGVFLLLFFVGISSQASKITGAASASITSHGQSGEVAVLGFAGIVAIIGLLFLALHTIRQKNIFDDSN